MARPRGAFYYLIGLPGGVSEAQAVELLAGSYGVLALPGSPFGAPGTLRISYGGLGQAAQIEESHPVK